MHECERLSHVRWECKYHVVIIPKFRRKNVPEHSAKVQRRTHGGVLKGKSAVRIHRELLGERRMTGLHFWATGYCVSTVGLDEDRIRKYIEQWFSICSANV